MRPRVFAALMIAGMPLLAGADSIKVGDQTYDNVYVSEGASNYYVCVPSDGTILNVPKGAVDPRTISIVDDREARKGLYTQWLAKRDKYERSSEAEGAGSPANEPARPAEADSSSQSSSNDETRTVRASGRRTAEVLRYEGTAQQDASYYSQQNEWEKLQRESALDARRRQYESEKYRQLTNRRVITSQDAKGGGGVKWQGGGNMGQSNFGGGYGGRRGW